jgi:Uri superfamily endonuclease
MTAFIRSSAEAPKKSGAYALLVELETPLRVTAGPKNATLAPGFYIYCGSANGPGGVAARLARHMRRSKRVHWHIDQLTAVGTTHGAWVFPDKSECEANEALVALPTPLEGFGSSDCRRCRSHLHFWPRGASAPQGWESEAQRFGGLDFWAGLVEMK